MEQELLNQQNQVFGVLVSTCESYISNIVLKEHGAEQLQEDLLVNFGVIILINPLQGFFKGCAWSWCSSESWSNSNVCGLCVG